MKILKKALTNTLSGLFATSLIGGFGILGILFILATLNAAFGLPIDFIYGPVGKIITTAMQSCMYASIPLLLGTMGCCEVKLKAETKARGKELCEQFTVEQLIELRKTAQEHCELLTCRDLNLRLMKELAAKSGPGLALVYDTETLMPDTQLYPEEGVDAVVDVFTQQTGKKYAAIPVSVFESSGKAAIKAIAERNTTDYYDTKFEIDGIDYAIVARSCSLGESTPISSPASSSVNSSITGIAPIGTDLNPGTNPNPGTDLMAQLPQ